MIVSAIIKQALRSLGVLDVNREPTAAQAANALDALNGMQRGMMGEEIGPRLDAVSLTGSLTGSYGAAYQCYLSAAGTLTLPANPQPGWRVGYGDARANFATYNLTINPNGRRISTVVGTYGTANVAVSTSGAQGAFFFREDAGWTLEQDWVLTDTPYFPTHLHTALADLLALVLQPQFLPEPPANLVTNAQRGRDLFVQRYATRAKALARPA